MSRHSFLLLLAVLVAAGLALLLVSVDSAAPTSLATVVEPPVRQVASEEQELAAELASETVPSAEPTDPSPESVAEALRERTPEGPAVYEEEEPTREWLLEIEVYPELQPGESLTIIAIRHAPGFTPYHSEWGRHGTLKNGKWLVDLSLDYKYPKRTPTHFEVEVRRYGFLTTTTVVRTETLNWAHEDEPAPGISRASYLVPMERSLTFCGVAVDKNGEPIENARVWILPPVDEEEGFDAFDHVQTGVLGRFCLEVPTYGEWLAVGMKDGFRPANYPLDTSAEPSEVRMVFDRGATFEVQIMFGEAPAVGMSVDVWNERPSGDLRGRVEEHLGADVVCWQGEHVERLQSFGYTDANGRVSAHGLEPHTYTVFVGRGSMSGTTGYSFEDETTRLSISLPSEEPLALNFEAAKIKVRLTGSEGLRTSLTLRRDLQYMKRLQFIESDTCTFYVNPLQTYSLQATDGECESEAVFIRTPEAGGECEVELHCGG